MSAPQESSLSASSEEQSHVIGLPATLPVTPLEEAVVGMQLSDAPVAPFGPGAQIAGYEVLGELGRGGMGVVYKARDLRLKRLVALKMILAGAHATSDNLARFQMEAEAAAKLHHPNIVQVFELGVHEGHSFFALEFVDGENLARRLRHELPQPKVAAKLVQTLAEAMHYAHQKGIIHRDLKPGNVLLAWPTRSPGHETQASAGELRPLTQPDSPTGPVPFADAVPKVADFGLAKQLDSGEARTASGAIFGTPSYMAPEQAEGNVAALGPRTDVYALGAILYELLTGRPPFRAANGWETISQVLGNDPVSPRQLQPNVPRDLETICLKCLQKDPARRYQRASKLGDDLRRFICGEPISARPVGRVERTWRWCKRNQTVVALLASVAASLVAGVAISTYFAIEARSQAKESQQYALEAGANAARADQAANDLKQENLIARRNLYTAQMNLADVAWRDRAVGQVRHLLKQLIPGPGELDLRGLEWYQLDRLCRDELRTLNHGSQVMSIVYSPDGQLLASAGAGATGVKLWDSASGRLLQSWRNNGSCVAFSPDGRRLAVVEDNQIRELDVTLGTQLRTLSGHSQQIHKFAYSADGRWLASCTEDWRTHPRPPGEVIIWDLVSGAEAHRLDGHKGSIRGVAFSPDSMILATAGADGSLKLWDTTSGGLLQNLAGAADFNDVAFSPDGKKLAAATGNNYGIPADVLVWDVATGQIEFRLKGHKALVWSVSFSPDGLLLASGSGDNTVKVWDAFTGLETRSFHTHASWVFCVAFSPDGRRIASGSSDRTVKLWDRMTDFQPRSFRSKKGPFAALSVSPDGNWAASATSDKSIKIWNLRSGHTLRTLVGHTERIHDLAFSPDSHALASASADGKIKLWNMKSGKEMRTVSPRAGTPVTVAFSPDGALLASIQVESLNRVEGQTSVTLWDTDRGTERFCFSQPKGRFVSLAFSPCNKWLATSVISREGRREGEIKMWETSTGQERFTLKLLDEVWSLAFSPNGQFIASAEAFSPKISIRDAVTGKELQVLLGHQGPVRRLIFAPGNRLVSVADAETTGTQSEIKIWDTITRQPLRTILGPKYVSDLFLSRDGDFLTVASKGVDGAVRVWDLRPWTENVRDEMEALGLVEFLIAKSVTNSNLSAAIWSNRTITEAVRDRALNVTRDYQEGDEILRNDDEGRALLLNSESWGVVVNQASDPQEFRLALRQAQLACRLAPNNGFYLNTLGAAQYRIGRYQDALSTLNQSDQLNKFEQPADAAFLAMAHYHLGHKDQAQREMNRLRTLLKKEQWVNNAEAQTLLHEAQETIKK